MLDALKRFIRPEPVVARLPDELRVYAIGDVHGRADLLAKLLAMIERDGAGRPAIDTQIIFLGDLIDRGPDSARVVDLALDLRARQPQTRFLMGNHEEIFLRVLAGDVQTLRFFLQVGGRETLNSYGLDDERIDRLEPEALIAELDALVPARHRVFLESLADMVVAGDYAFVHAGVRPGVALEDQAPEDLRWIRQPFLRHRKPFGAVVVHGHTITDAVDERSNRIGIDTGAFSSGMLTAIGLDGSERWYLST